MADNRDDSEKVDVVIDSETSGVDAAAAGGGEDQSSEDKKTPNVDQDPPPPLFHSKVRKELVQPVVLLFKKVIDIHDLDKWFKRLHITEIVKLQEYLTEEETRRVEEKDGLIVITRDQAGKEYTKMTLHFAREHNEFYLEDEWWNFKKARNLEKRNTLRGRGYSNADNEFRLILHINTEENQTSSSSVRSRDDAADHDPEDNKKKKNKRSKASGNQESGQRLVTHKFL